MNPRINILNKHIMSMDFTEIPIGLFSGKMGLSIYFFLLARKTSNKAYETFAGKLLNDIYEKVHQELPHNPANGLSGICMGINYLIEQDLVKGIRIRSCKKQRIRFSVL